MCDFSFRAFKRQFQNDKKQTEVAAPESMPRNINAGKAVSG
jgi:hypothetical protein